ncbi:MAG TPA: aspartate kinase [Candidatus Limnocylindria bacterium]|nr:aspartate kinase [Candidatus Limnocylindria bacterium]
MISIAEAVAELVKQSPLLEEGLSRNLMNISAVARDMKPRVEQRVFKDVTEGAVVMALQRLSTTLPSQDRSSKVFQGVPDMVIRSNLFEVTLGNSPSLLDKQQQLLTLAVSYRNKYFLTITSGVFETTIIASNALHEKITAILEGETILSEIPSLSSVTIRLSESILAIPGSYAQILKFMAWEGINIIEVVSTYLELTVVLKQDEADRAFSVLKNAFK